MGETAKQVKYKVAKGWEKRVVYCKPPKYREGKENAGKFVLSECSQTDLKYLATEKKHPGVVIV